MQSFDLAKTPSSRSKGTTVSFKTTPMSLYEVPKPPPIVNLRVYCEARVQAKKPDWQVEAEHRGWVADWKAEATKNGWAPPAP